MIEIVAELVPFVGMIADPNAVDIVNEAMVVKKMFATFRKDAVSFVVSKVQSK